MKTISSADGRMMITVRALTCVVLGLLVAGCEPRNRKPYSYRDVRGMRFGGDYIKLVEYPTGAPRSSTLKPPILIYPTDRSVFGHYPRELLYRWKPAKGTPKDAQYLYQLDYGSGNAKHFGGLSQERPYDAQALLTGKTSLNQLFIGAQPGRWRVKTIDNTGESDWTEWRYLRFTR